MHTLQDYRLLLPHGSESALPGRVGQFSDRRDQNKTTDPLRGSLAILKLNGPELLECTDDGAFIKSALPFISLCDRR